MVYIFKILLEPSIMFIGFFEIYMCCKLEKVNPSRIEGIMHAIVGSTLPCENCIYALHEANISSVALGYMS
jgi:hypothetical protein